MPTKAQVKALKAKGIVHYWLKVLPVRARARGLDFNLTESSFPEFLPIKCPFTGIKLEYLTENRPNRNTASIDRIDNTKGYVHGNIQIVSYFYNSTKSNTTRKQRLNFVAREYLQVIKRYLSKHLNKYTHLVLDV